MSLFSRIFAKSAVFDAPLRPNTPFVAIGDIHGNMDEMSNLLSTIDTFADVPKQLVFVGDYIDRGDNSAAVLRSLFDLARSRSAICLLGNHEQMMLDFLHNPVGSGRKWLQFGGLQTLASFDLFPPSTTPGHDACRNIASRLGSAIGSDLLNWLSSLPPFWQSGNVVAAHAALDPNSGIDDQSTDTLLWGHPKFRRKRRKDGMWVVHGHTIVPEPLVKDGVISIDTGAFATGSLSAAIIRRDGLEFLRT